MVPKKRKSSKVILEEEEKPKIPVDLKEEPEAKEEEPEKAKKTEKKEQGKGEKIKQNIDKVKTRDGVIGYILRNEKSASIDLKDPTKIIDYAVLSSSALEASKELSNAFELGDVKHVLVEGNTVKLLSFTIEENKVSVFMEKKVDHNRVYKDLL